ncbi:hypothetical protein FVEN_g4854 [Fusarium venenatum]|nr:hypothetical protein FVEN_g4854 [Fusarium venenatum]
MLAILATRRNLAETFSKCGCDSASFTSNVSPSLFPSDQRWVLLESLRSDNIKSLNEFTDDFIFLVFRIIACATFHPVPDIYLITIITSFSAVSMR